MGDRGRPISALRLGSSPGRPWAKPGSTLASGCRSACAAAHPLQGVLEAPVAVTVQVREDPVGILEAAEGALNLRKVHAFSRRQAKLTGRPEAFLSSSPSLARSRQRWRRSATPSFAASRWVVRGRVGRQVAELGAWLAALQAVRLARTSTRRTSCRTRFALSHLGRTPLGGCCRGVEATAPSCAGRCGEERRT